MQSNSEKQGYPNQSNNYSSENIYPSYQGTPYPQQPTSSNGYTTSNKGYDSQTPLHCQQGVVIAPVYQPYWNNVIRTPITSNIRAFFIISGLLYCLWGILAFSFQLAITVNSYSSYYHGFWTGTSIVFGGITMMIIACRPSYPMRYLTRMLIVILVFSVAGFVFSVVNYSGSTRCLPTSTWRYCDYLLSSHLKIILPIILILSAIHTVINVIFVSKIHKKTVSTANSNH